MHIHYSYLICIFVYEPKNLPSLLKQKTEVLFEEIDVLYPKKSVVNFNEHLVQISGSLGLYEKKT